MLRKLSLALVFVAALSGCQTVRPISEFTHLSHASDGLGGPGYDMFSAGIRWRPAPGVTIDLLEGLSTYQIDESGYNEVFTGRVTFEF